MLYVATSKVSWIILGLGFFAAGAVIATLLFSHVQRRIDGWLGALTPEEFNKTPGGSYQLVQGLFGMANGGLVGTGLGEGRPNMVPYAESDFIYASFGEELGMAGLFVILLCYLLIFERGIRTAQKRGTASAPCSPRDWPSRSPSRSSSSSAVSPASSRSRA